MTAAKQEPRTESELDRLRVDNARLTAELARERDRCPECRCVRSDAQDLPLDFACKSCGKSEIMGVPGGQLKTARADD